MPPSRGSSRPRDRTCVSCSSCTTGVFFTAELPGKPLFLTVNLTSAQTSSHPKHDFSPLEREEVILTEPLNYPQKTEQQIMTQEQTDL